MPGCRQTTSDIIATKGNTFSKQERLCSEKCIDRLFKEGNRQIAAFPVRFVWLKLNADEFKGVRVLISAPKRNFHHAVDRNHIKRQIREFYRTQSHTLKNVVDSGGYGLALAILFVDSRIWQTDKLSPRLGLAMQKLVGKLSEPLAGPDSQDTVQP